MDTYDFDSDEDSNYDVVIENKAPFMLNRCLDIQALLDDVTERLESSASSGWDTSSASESGSSEDDISEILTLDLPESTIPPACTFETVPESPSDIIANRLITLIQSYSPKDLTTTPLRRAVFESAIKNAVESAQPLRLVLPAFRFKSPNRNSKVMGAMPDLGEERALVRLEALCASLDDIYPSTRLLILSDGLVYSDIFNVPEQDIWNYENALRKIAKAKCPHISFCRLEEVVAHDENEAETMEEYVSHAGWYRDQLVAKFLPEDFHVSVELRKNVDVLRKYRGHVKLLETDLRDDNSRQGLSDSKAKKMNHTLAKKMIKRGTAFSNAVQQAFPDAARLSIHASTSEVKMPISLLVNNEEFSTKIANYTTPWNCAPALHIDGSFRFEHSEVFAHCPKYDLIFRNGRPSHYRQKSGLFNWSDVDVVFEPLYPCGFLIKPRNTAAPVSVQAIDMQKVRELAEENSPIVLRGFTETTDGDLLVDKAREMGTLIPGGFSELQDFRDADKERNGLENASSIEAVPVQSDGSFQEIEEREADGTQDTVPRSANFQLMTVGTSVSEKCRQTLIASSRILFSLLPEPYNIPALQKMTLNFETAGSESSQTESLDLVISHPSLGTPCLNHKVWGRDETGDHTTTVYIDNRPEELLQLIDGLLYDRRVCYYHEWLAGDVVVSDNVNMLHGPDRCTLDSPGEVWRIYTN